jgi:hypothetical protein
MNSVVGCGPKAEGLKLCKNFGWSSYFKYLATGH